MRTRDDKFAVYFILNSVLQRLWQIFTCDLVCTVDVHRRHFYVGHVTAVRTVRALCQPMREHFLYHVITATHAQTEFASSRPMATIFRQRSVKHMTSAAHCLNIQCSLFFTPFSPICCKVSESVLVNASFGAAAVKLTPVDMILILCGPS